MHARIYDFTLTAGGMQRLPVVGDFFKVITSTGTINVSVDTGAALDLLPGQGLREFPFNTLTISDKSGAANAGKILVGFSAMVDDRVTGDVTVIDSVGVNCQTPQLATSTAIGLQTVQLINPAANVNGALIRYVGVTATAGAGGTVNGRILAAASQPVTLQPGNNSVILGGVFNDTTSSKDFVSADLKKRIPVGWGVWHLANIVGAAASISGFSISFELL